MSKKTKRGWIVLVDFDYEGLYASHEEPLRVFFTKKGAENHAKKITAGDSRELFEVQIPLSSSRVTSAKGSATIWL